MKNAATFSPKPFLREWFPSFILLLGFLPDVGIAAAVNISCPETIKKGDLISLTCAIDAAALVREYGCESSSDMVNFTINRTNSMETPCSVQFLHSHFCLTLESSPSFCQCVHVEENILTYQYLFQPSDADMDAEIFCSIGCYNSSQYFLIESNRCKVFNMYELMSKRMYTERSRLRSRRLLLTLTMTSLLICTGNDQLNPGSDQHSETKSYNIPNGTDVDNVVKKMFERQQEKLLADFDVVKSQLTSVQDAFNRVDTDIDGLHSRVSLLEARNKEMKDKDEARNRNQMAWWSTAGKATSAVIGAITIIALLGMVLRKIRFKSASSNNNTLTEMRESSPDRDDIKKKIRNINSGAVLEKHNLKPDREEIHQDKVGVEHELGPMNV